jgi:response regulator RpfG family c-di-GMP phosphodiesterase
MYRILLVDDEPNVLNALRRELQSDYAVEAFSNPHDALQHCQKTRFDLAIVDYKMPEMSGVEFLCQFGKLQPDAVRLMLSGEADFNALIDTINEAHIDRFISKPWNHTELTLTLAFALAQREQVLKNHRLTEVCRNPLNGQQAQNSDRVYQVLVVDDEPNVLSAIARELNASSGFKAPRMAMSSQGDQSSRDLHFNVFTTTSAIKALEQAKQISYDVVISDYKMPEMDGLHFLEAFSEIQPDAARILLSGNADKDALVSAINFSNIYGYISKPWHEYILRNTLAQAILYHDLLHENRLLAEQAGG